MYMHQIHMKHNVFNEPNYQMLLNEGEEPKKYVK